MRIQSKISMLVLIALLFTMSGCGIERVRALIQDIKILRELGSRQVESAVIPLEKSEGRAGDDPALLFSTNEGKSLRATVHIPPVV